VTDTAQPTTAPPTTPPPASAPAAPSTARIDLGLFALLGFFWGSSYLFIKIGVEGGLTPFTLITLRLLIGFALLVTVVLIALSVAAVVYAALSQRASTPAYLAAE